MEKSTDLATMLEMTRVRMPLSVDLLKLKKSKNKTPCLRVRQKGGTSAFTPNVLTVKAVEAR